MRAAILTLCLAFALVASGPAAAQSLFETGPAPEDPPAPEAGPAEGEVAQRLIEILEDEAAREALIRQLRTAAQETAAQEIAAQETGVTVPAAGEAQEPEAQLSVARQIAERTRDVAEGTAGFLRSVTGSATDVLGVFTGDRAVNWAELRAALVALAVVAAVTLALFLVLRAFGQWIFRIISERAGHGGWIVSLVRLIGSSLIDALIITIAWAGGHAFALYFGEPGSMDFRQSLFLNAFLLVELTRVALRGVLAPGFGRLRLAPMTDATARHWYFWCSRVVGLLGYGILLVVPIVNTAVSFAVGRSLTLLIVVTALAMAVAVVIANRGSVRRALSARNARDPDDLLGRFEAMLGTVWHWLAIAYLLALFAVWSANPRDALQFMMIATAKSALAVVAGVAVMVLISRAISGGIRLPGHVRTSLPLLEGRLGTFVPTILKALRGLTLLAVLITIAQVWGVIDFLGWAASEGGGATLSQLLSALFIALVALGLWLAVSSLVEYRLNPEVGSVPTARERTLLALFRNAFMIVLAVLAAMLALSELGVNIAPLLAGAGVIGLAIGFGAQKLVQDIITGAFIQFENAMNEGDVVTAGGTTGVVERLTIRSVGLRDVSGTYHLIPFSSVDMVSNFMKGWAFHVAEVGVAYRENVAEVKDLMRRADEILRAGELGEFILEPIDIQGVVALGDSAVVVRGRIKTTAGQQWVVGRAYNEIVKDVLDEAGVEIPYPHMTLYMGQDKDGGAPPLNLRRIDAGGSALPRPETGTVAAAGGPEEVPLPERREAGPEPDGQAVDVPRSEEGDPETT